MDSMLIPARRKGKVSRPLLPISFKEMQSFRENGISERRVQMVQIYRFCTLFCPFSCLSILFQEALICLCCLFPQQKKPVVGSIIGFKEETYTESDYFPILGSEGRNWNRSAAAEGSTRLRWSCCRSAYPEVPKIFWYVCVLIFPFLPLLVLPSYFLPSLPDKNSRCVISSY